MRVEPERASAYIGSLPLESPSSSPSPAHDPDAHLTTGSREDLATFWLTLDAINFGSGWVPTLRQRDGQSGYY